MIITVVPLALCMQIAEKISQIAVKVCRVVLVKVFVVLPFANLKNFSLQNSRNFHFNAQKVSHRYRWRKQFCGRTYWKTKMRTGRRRKHENKTIYALVSTKRQLGHDPIGGSLAFDLQPTGALLCLFRSLSITTETHHINKSSRQTTTHPPIEKNRRAYNLL